MAMKNIRLFVTLEPALSADVKSLASTKGTTLSRAARDLINGGCAAIEDRGLTMLAARREASGRVRRWLRHDEVWK